MKHLITLALCGLSAAAQAHVVLAEPVALANTSYRAAFRVGHGCEGRPTTAIRVSLPAGFQGAKPMPKAGWALRTRLEKIAQPYNSHGKTITDDVVEVTWTATAPEHALPDAWYDEFVLRGQLAVPGGALWFKVLQTCDQGATDWAEVPSHGTSTKGMKAPAVLLDVMPSNTVHHH